MYLLADIIITNSSQVHTAYIFYYIIQNIYILYIYQSQKQTQKAIAHINKERIFCFYIPTTLILKKSRKQRQRTNSKKRTKYEVGGKQFV